MDLEIIYLLSGKWLADQRIKNVTAPVEEVSQISKSQIRSLTLIKSRNLKSNLLLLSQGVGFFLIAWIIKKKLFSQFRLQTMEWTTTNRPKWGQFGAEKRGLDQKNFTRIPMTTMTTERNTKMGTTEESLSKISQTNAKRTTVWIWKIQLTNAWG